MKKKKKKKKLRKKSRQKIRKVRIKLLGKRRSSKRRKTKYKKNKRKLTNNLKLLSFLIFFKPKIIFNFKKIYKKITTPIVKKIKDFKKNRHRAEISNFNEQDKERKRQSSLRKEILKREIKEEQVLAKSRAKELKNFLRQEQKAIREKEKEKQIKFLEEVKLEKTLERFRDRELEEIKSIEKYSLNIEKEDFNSFQKRIDEVREKYKALRNERLRKRVEELGVTLSDKASIDEIRQKEKEYLERRELIETSLESFTRSAISLVYQINKRYLPKNADLLRVINLVYEQSEIIIREDQEQNENFLILIYVKDQDAQKEIIVEDKIKQETREYNRNAIFKFGDDLTDSLILYLERMRESLKKAS